MCKVQDLEISTIQERNITLKLSDADVQRLSDKAGRHGLSVAALLENFIGDLVCGTYTNGSDEVMYAQQWFERCYFGLYPDYTFLSYLIDYYDIEDIVLDWNELQYYKSISIEEYEDLDEDLINFEELDERLNGIFEDYKSFSQATEKDKTLDEAMLAVINHYEEYEKIKCEEK